MKKFEPAYLRIWICIGVTIVILSACTTWDPIKYPRHAFSFDTKRDSPDAEVLEYEYGSKRKVGSYSNSAFTSVNQNFPAENTSGPILRGDFLYVKWRIRSHTNAGEYIGYYEDRVDLRSRLPENITGLRIHFLIKGSQLYVYLISPELKLASEADGPVSQYKRQIQTQIYPDQAQQSSTRSHID